jgi:hypothetical protein
MRKNAQLSVRITEQEMANLREAANQESVLLSQLIRNILAANSKHVSTAYDVAPRQRTTGGLIPRLGRRFPDGQPFADALPNVGYQGVKRT